MPEVLEVNRTDTVTFLELLAGFVNIINAVIKCDQIQSNVILIVYFW